MTQGIGAIAPEVDAFRFVGRVQQYGAFLVRIAFLLDAAALYCGLYLAAALLGFDWAQRFVTLALLGIIVFGLITSLRGLNRMWRLQRLRMELVEVACLLTLSFLALALLLAVGTQWGADAAHLRVLVVWWGLALVGIAGGRALLRLLLRFWRAGSSEHRRVAIYGTSEAARRLARVFRQHSWMGLDVVGIFDDREGPEGLDGGLDALVRLARNEQISAVYLALPVAGEVPLKDIIDRFADTTVSLHYCPALFDLDLLGARWDDVFGLPVISVIASPFDGVRRYLKRLEDLLLALVLLPFVVVVGLAVAIAVKLTSPGPVLYLQTRHGLGGRPFKIAKFRTMYRAESDEEFVQAKGGDSRITPLGRFLRRTSLDELPQFLNVLNGDMSIVGPRPAPVKYNEEQRRVIYRYMLRHKVKPGITGLAQVNGSRGETDTLEKIEQRTAYDLQYINNWSLGLDLRIILRTVGMVVGEFLPR